MSAARPQSSSDNFWPESGQSSALPPYIRKRGESGETLFSLDEAPDIHNPYSDLSLFLSQKIKQEIHSHGSIKKWSLKIQEELIHKITPDFQKQFPKYRLGISALRKTWDKVSFYLDHIQNQKEALTQEGKLNIPFFIRENLKAVGKTATAHPHHFAHQLAAKLSECAAAIDGVKPKLEHLTKMIWSLQRHMLSASPEQLRSPYDEYDKIDKLIVKLILEITAKEPQISQKQLEHKVKEALNSLHELPSFATLDMMTFTVAALFAEKRFAALSQDKTALVEFIAKQVDLCKTAFPHLKLTDLVRRLVSFYALCRYLPKDLTEEQFKNALSLPQSVYAFISAQTIFGEKCIWDTYCQARDLPQFDEIEMVIWKVLSDKESLLEKLPYRIGQRIEEEIAGVLIDNPKQSFAEVIQRTTQFFQRTKELYLNKESIQELERKVHVWTIQGDLLCRWIKLDHESPLLKMILEKCKDESFTSHLDFVSQVCTTYLQQNPELAPYAPQVNVRIWILYKYSWYTFLNVNNESSLHRFLKWHNNATPEQLQKILPYIPL